MLAELAEKQQIQILQPSITYGQSFNLPNPMQTPYYDTTDTII